MALVSYIMNMLLNRSNNRREFLRTGNKTWRAMEDVGKERPVAGFVIVMYNDGAAHVVEKLRENNPK